MGTLIDYSKQPALEIGEQDRCEIKQVNSDNVFTFPEGILGFEDLHDYIFIMNEKVSPFMFMQSIEDSDLSFVCVEVFQICPDYSIQIPQESVDFLDLESAGHAFVLCLVTVRQNVEATTANLMSPIVVNMKNMRAKQVILEHSEYPVRYKVWEAISRSNSMFNAG